jgi:hypothetical protein
VHTSTFEQNYFHSTIQGYWSIDSYWTSWLQILSLLCLQSRGEYSVRVPAGPCQLSFFKIWPFSAEFHITYMYSIYIYLAKIMLLRENLLFMDEFFNSHHRDLPMEDYFSRYRFFSTIGIGIGR